MRRRAFLAFAAVAVGTPLSALSQPRPGARTIGYLSPRSAGVEAHLLDALRIGLSESGYVEGQNLVIEYRWAEGRYERLPELAADLARRRVSAIVTSGGPQPARAARSAGADHPVIFISGSDPVQDGLVSNLNRPGGQTTGIVVFTTSLGPKRLELLRELLPRPTGIGFLVNPRSAIAEIQVREIEAAARAVRQPLHVLQASTPPEIDAAFATLVERKAGALLMSADLFFQVQREQLVALAARHAIPTMYEWPEFVAAGGLVSYSTARGDDYRKAGAYVGRILQGAKPGELPILRSTKFELTLNLKTAKSLGLTIPAPMLLRADHVID